MGNLRQGKFWEGALLLLIVLVFCLAFSGLLLLPHRSPCGGIKGRQVFQLGSLDAGVRIFASEFKGFPPSDANDPAGQPYCGSMKLMEALMGQDLLGFHAKSVFRQDGLDANGVLLYRAGTEDLPRVLRESTLTYRRVPFPGEMTGNPRRLVDIYGRGNTGPFPENTFVLCDCYWRDGPSGKRTGMPILYYRANPSGTTHDVTNPDNPQNIYNYRDNQALIALGVPGSPGATHPLIDPRRFYLNTQDRKALPRSAPYRADSFILISAGPDGLYGTADDICNFDWE
jgi:hypothetical protein